MITALILVVSLVFWWFWFGMEMLLNGGGMGYPYAPWTMLFYHWWHMTLEHLPFIIGKHYRYEHTGGINGIYKGREKERQEWEDALWMPFRYLILCWCLPFGPAIAYHFWG